MPSKKRRIDAVSSEDPPRSNLVEGHSEEFWDENPEFPHHYGPGKLHPVLLGDLFNRSRYKVIRKLGSGSFSTVWLARDRKMKRYVALKVPTANTSVSENEIKIHGHLSRQKLQHPGQKHVMTLLDSFEHQGPNGTHRCLVLEVMGPNANNMVVKIPRPLRPLLPQREHAYQKTPRYPFWMAKSMLRQILLGIDYLHKCDIVHGDLQPGNILFSVHNLSSLAEDDLAHPPPKNLIEKTVNRRREVKFHVIEDQNRRKGYYTQRQIDGKPDPSSPPYMLYKEPMFGYVDFDAPPQVKISDLGGAVLKSQGKPVTPLGLRSPEMILGEPIGRPQDIWSFGCLFFEFLTCRMLFSICSPFLFSKRKPVENGGGKSEGLKDNSGHGEAANGNDQKTNKGSNKNSVNKQKAADRKDEEEWADTNDGHILDIARLLGPVPPSFMARFPRSKTYFNERGEVIKDYVGGPPSKHVSDERDLDPLKNESIDDYLEREKGTDLNRKEAEAAKKLLRTILQIDAADRPTAEELLAHPWFAEPQAEVRS